MLKIPQYVKHIIEKINSYGYDAYLVGGAVRDYLLGFDIKDYDISTNCDIDNLFKIFKDYKIINKNGLKHNTITIRYLDNNIEVTCFKHNVDEENSIKIDLSHRDFTINSLAYNNEIIDYYNGLDDLKNKIIRCNNAEDRIKEDPLRILRALRFKSKLGFEIESDTSEVIHKYKDLLNNVSKERIKTELEGILIGDYLDSVLDEYYDVFFVIIKELEPCYNFNQKNPHHKNTLYKHIINVCSNVYKNQEVDNKTKVTVRLAGLLHDIGKIKTFTIDDNGIGHFYTHPIVSSKMAYDILKNLRFSNEDIYNITYLIKYHDSVINLTKKSVKKNLANAYKNDERLFYMLLELINSDRLDHVNHELLDINKIKEIVNLIKEENMCFKLVDLKINGNDLIDLGYSGKIIGSILNDILELVKNDVLENDKTLLIEYVKRKYENDFSYR